MSELDIKALEANFDNWKASRAPDLKVSDAFERFVVDQVLKDQELSDEEVDSGIAGGTDDGGVDAVYFFINTTLILEETELPEPAVTADLYIIQAKYEKGFSETAVEKMHQFARDMLTFSTPVEKLTYLNSVAKDLISLFRDKYSAILASKHTLTIHFHYATKSDQGPHPKVIARVEKLRTFVKSQISAAVVEFDFWGSDRLLKAARSQPNRRLTIDFSKQFTTSDKSAVCLAKLTDFAKFLSDENGELRRHLFEPNVRDYQGKNNTVNEDIRASLKTADVKEFWWLNNGITILATDCSIAGETLVIDQPEIVNGLQTSQEIFDYFKENPGQKDARNILIRVVLPPDEQARNKITKATNFQSAVNPVSLHATDAIHFDIEEKLKLYGLFYDRRKGEHRNLGKPISAIVSIKELATMVIAMVLRQPDNARARPQSLLVKEDTYNQVFDKAYNRDVYLVAALIDRQVKRALADDDDLDKDSRRNIRYYVDLCVACALTEKAQPTVAQLAKLVSVVVKPIDGKIMARAIVDASDVYEDQGETDKAAKSLDMREAMQEYLDEHYK